MTRADSAAGEGLCKQMAAWLGPFGLAHATRLGRKPSRGANYPTQQLRIEQEIHDLALLPAHVPTHPSRWRRGFALQSQGISSPNDKTLRYGTGDRPIQSLVRDRQLLG